MTPQKVIEVLFPEQVELPSLEVPDFEKIHKDLAYPGVTLKSLWQEYVMDCRLSNKPYYKQSYFNDLYRDFSKKHHLTMRIKHKPAHRIMVGWSGKTTTIKDRTTGELKTVYLFVGSLPYSMYCYVQACLSMKMDQWIDAHIKMFEFFGGVSRIIVPDNLKTSVIHHRKYEDPLLNKSYLEMMDYFGCAVLPARPRKPKDKAAVEGSVDHIVYPILGRLRHQTFSYIRILKSEVVYLEASD